MDWGEKNTLTQTTIQTGDEFPRRLCDPLPPVIVFYHVSLQPTSGNIKQQSQGVGGHRVYVGIRHPKPNKRETVFHHISKHQEEMYSKEFLTNFEVVEMG